MGILPEITSNERLELAGQLRQDLDIKGIVPEDKIIDFEWELNNRCILLYNKKLKKMKTELRKRFSYYHVPRTHNGDIA